MIEAKKKPEESWLKKRGLEILAIAILISVPMLISVIPWAPTFGFGIGTFVILEAIIVFFSIVMVLAIDVLRRILNWGTNDSPKKVKVEVKLETQKGGWFERKKMQIAVLTILFFGLTMCKTTADFSLSGIVAAILSGFIISLILLGGYELLGNIFNSTKKKLDRD